MYVKQMIDIDSVETLVRSAREGDRKAFKTLYNQYKQSVYRAAYRLLGDRMRAEDITQEVFVNIHHKLNTFEFESTFSTWCYRITVNACYDVMRKHKRREKYNDGLIEPGTYEAQIKSPRHTQPEEILNRKELHGLINEKLQSIHEDLKTTFVLREFEKLSYREIADVMSCSEGTVASRLARARDHLADYLSKFGIDGSYLN
jgi:RNA polymerase sigma-70 factor (ECF subfamily)